MDAPYGLETFALRIIEEAPKSPKMEVHGTPAHEVSMASVD